eukprot:gene1649-3190_t
MGNRQLLCQFGVLFILSVVLIFYRFHIFDHDNGRSIHFQGLKVSDTVLLSFKSSNGFFHDIPDEDWKLKWEIHCNESRKDLQFGSEVSKALYDESKWKLPNFWSHFWQANYEPTWSCGMERRLGLRSDGGKWICDPHRISRNRCLVYSLGSHEQYDFEVYVNTQIPGCEIHTFDPFFNGTGKPSYLNYHQMGIKGHITAQDANVTSNNLVFETLPAIIQKLNHTGLTIDILKIDVEGEEFDILTDELFHQLRSLQTTIRQIALEIHPGARSPNTNDSNPIDKVRQLFDVFEHNNYLIFHREPNILFRNHGQVIEYSLVLIEHLQKCNG